MRMWKCLAFLLAVMFLTCGCAAGWVTEETVDEMKQQEAQKGESAEDDVNLGGTEIPVEYAFATEYTLARSQRIVKKVTDGQKNYFFVYLGSAENFPVFSESPRYYPKLESFQYADNSDNPTDLLPVAAFANAFADLANEEFLAVEHSQYGWGGIEFRYGNAALDISQRELGFENENGVIVYYEKPEAFSDTVAARYSARSSKKIVYDKSALQNGYFRYTLYADFDLYALVTADIYSGELSYTYLPYAKKGSIGEAIVYSESRYTEAYLEDRLFVLKQEGIINEDFFASGLPKMKDAPLAHLQGEFLDSDGKRISHDGVYGVEHLDQAEKLSLDELQSYMNGDYTFEFSVYLQAEEYDEGYKEVYLYNSLFEKIKDSEDKVDKKKAAKLGMVAGYTFTEKGREIFSWTVSGADCRDEMYILYDASGKGNDDWIKERISIFVTVREAN